MALMGRRAHSNLQEAGAVGGSLGVSACSAALSACCAGPWLVALFGMSGAVLIVRLEPYRHVLLAPAAALLGQAIWRETKRPGSRIAVRLALGAALVALLGAGFLPGIVAIWAGLRA